MELCSWREDLGGSRKVSKACMLVRFLNLPSVFQRRTNLVGGGESDLSPIHRAMILALSNCLGLDISLQAKQECILCALPRHAMQQSCPSVADMAAFFWH